MPEISRFYGIIISMYHDDHGQPHFHADHGEFEASIAIASLDFLGGACRILRADAWLSGPPLTRKS